MIFRMNLKYICNKIVPVYFVYLQVLIIYKNQEYKFTNVVTTYMTNVILKAL